MLRITQVAHDANKVVLKLEGRLVDEWVTLLEETYETFQRRTGMPLILDLSGVSFTSEEGINLLRCLQKAGAKCVSCSLFLQAILTEKR